MSKMSQKIGPHIRNIRKNKGITLEKLSEKSNLSLTYVGDIERGKKEPSLKSLRKISNALDVSISYLLKPIDKIKDKTTLEILIKNKEMEEFLKTLENMTSDEIKFFVEISKVISERLKELKRN